MDVFKKTRLQNGNHFYFPVLFDVRFIIYLIGQVCVMEDYFAILLNNSKDFQDV